MLSSSHFDGGSLLAACQPALRFQLQHEKPKCHQVVLAAPAPDRSLNIANISSNKTLMRPAHQVKGISQESLSVAIALAPDLAHSLAPQRNIRLRLVPKHMLASARYGSFSDYGRTSTGFASSNILPLRHDGAYHTHATRASCRSELQPDTGAATFLAEVIYHV